ncbi:hypothetical protein A2W24_01250 [Microgenomates group bacterium RBG_16_45_19]|nr:MAG: hypothetical protein A2W24_01250 [Microgenomates group bacterium RBG_16_45_19]
MNVANTVTRQDLDRIEASLAKVLRASRKGNVEPAYLDLLEKIVDALNDLRLTVEFEHEERLQAIESYLSNL